MFHPKYRQPNWDPTDKLCKIHVLNVQSISYCCQPKCRQQLFSINLRTACSGKMRSRYYNKGLKEWRNHLLSTREYQFFHLSRRFAFHLEHLILHKMFAVILNVHIRLALRFRLTRDVLKCQVACFHSTGYGRCSEHLAPDHQSPPCTDIKNGTIRKRQPFHPEFALRPAFLYVKSSLSDVKTEVS